MRKCAYILVLLVLTLYIAGCGKNEEIQHITVSDDSASTILFAKDADTMPIDIVIINECGVDVGMLSIIDPNTKEQINVSSVADGIALSIKANWPKDENTLHWALYNKKGELCIEASSDITGITEAAIVTISGDGDVEKVDLNVR